MTRGRKSHAKILLNELQDEEETDRTYLVTYDFIENKPHHRFWSNLSEIISQVEGEMIQYSTYIGEKKGAKAVRELASLYGADVRWFLAYEIR